EGGYESRTVENWLDATEGITAFMERRSRAEPTAPADGGRDAGSSLHHCSQRGRRCEASTFDDGACGCLMRFLRDWACWLLLVLAIGCFVIGTFPQWSEWIDPANGDKVSERRHGLWFSPSYKSVRRAHLDLGRGGGFGTTSGPRWLSWSSLMILIGFVCLGVIRWRLEQTARCVGP